MPEYRTGIARFLIEAVWPPARYARSVTSTRDPRELVAAIKSDMVWERVLLVVLLVVGIALRLRQYFYNRSLWIDEAFVSLSIVPRSLAELLKPLGWDQTGPILFLWAEKAMVELFGVSEYALRALPLVAGLILLPTVYALAQRLFGAAPALLATAVAALSPSLIRYATEVKSYGIEALTTIVLVTLAVRIIDEPAEWRHWLPLALTGALAIFISTPAVFVLAGVSCGLLLAPSVRHTPRAFVSVLVLGGCWVFFFAVAYLVLLRPTANNEFLQHYFAPTFLSPRSPDLGGRVLGALGRTVHPTIYYPLVPDLIRAGVLVIAALGVITLARRCGLAFAAMFAIPYCAAFAAAVIERFPIIPRTMLFAAPLLIIAVAGGVFSAASRLPRRFATLALAAGVFVVAVPSALKAIRDAVEPFHDFDVRPAVEALMRLNTEGEPVYVSYFARPAYTFYTTNWQAPDTARIRWFDLARSARTPNDPTLPQRFDGGDAFVRQYQGRTEIVQRLPVGVANTFLTPGESVLTSEAWATTEARRIRSYARPFIWLLLTDGPWGNRDLLRAIQATRGKLVYTNSSWKNLYLYRVLFE
jgi:hypothetical protein